VKLTKEIRSQIDKMSPHQIYTMFRFHPTNMTTGETGRYLQDTARNKIVNDKKELSGEPKRKVFGIT
jgi:hypothetical protein